MHFIPQVVIAAIAWGAGQQDLQQQHDPKNTAPEAIQNAYNVLRKHIRDDSKYAEAEKRVKQVEQALRQLNSELWDSLPPDDQVPGAPDDIKAAYSLLQALDNETMTWRQNISDY